MPDPKFPPSTVVVVRNWEVAILGNTVRELVEINDALRQQLDAAEAVIRGLHHEVAEAHHLLPGQSAGGRSQA